MSEPDVDLLIALRRFEEAADRTRDEATRQRLLDLGLGWGHYRLVQRFRRRLDATAYETFLRERALPQVPWRRANGRVHVDRAVLSAIADDLGISVPDAATAAGLTLAAHPTANLGKLDDLAQISNHAHLRDQVFERRTLQRKFPRAVIEENLHAALAHDPHFAILQRGDTDEDDPKAPWVYACSHPSGTAVVWKEHLALPTNWSALGGNDEPGLLRSVEHSGVVRLLETDADSGPRLWFAMPRIHSHRLPVPEFADVVIAELAVVLTALHDAGIVVFDVKPDNVLWEDDRPVVIDLGYAQRVPTLAPDTATLHGSAAFVPPEVLRTWRGGAASDVFQLGLCWYHWLTGQHAFTDVSVPPDAPHAREHYARAILAGEVRWRVPGLPLAVYELLRAMLAPEPRDRPTAAQVATTLEDEFG